MKNGIAILLCCLLGSTAAGQTAIQPDPKLEMAIQKVMLCFEKGDSMGLQQLIHPDIGVVVLYRIGATNKYLIDKGMQFKKEEYHHQMDLGGTKNLKIIAHAEPEYDCDQFTYPKNSQGIYVTPAEQEGNNLFSTIVTHQAAYESEENRDMWNFAKTLEHYGVRVTFIGPEGHAIFYMVLKDGVWYFCMYDTITTDCSA